MLFFILYLGIVHYALESFSFVQKFQNITHSVQPTLMTTTTTGNHTFMYHFYEQSHPFIKNLSTKRNLVSKILYYHSFGTSWKLIQSGKYQQLEKIWKQISVLAKSANAKNQMSIFMSYINEIQEKYAHPYYLKYTADLIYNDDELIYLLYELTKGTWNAMQTFNDNEENESVAETTRSEKIKVYMKLIKQIPYKVLPLLVKKSKKLYIIYPYLEEIMKSIHAIRISTRLPSILAKKKNKKSSKINQLKNWFTSFFNKKKKEIETQQDLQLKQQKQYKQQSIVSAKENDTAMKYNKNSYQQQRRLTERETKNGAEIPTMPNFHKNEEHFTALKNKIDESLKDFDTSTDFIGLLREDTLDEKEFYAQYDEIMNSKVDETTSDFEKAEESMNDKDSNTTPQKNTRFKQGDSETSESESSSANEETNDSISEGAAKFDDESMSFYDSASSSLSSFSSSSSSSASASLDDDDRDFFYTPRLTSSTSDMKDTSALGNLLSSMFNLGINGGSNEGIIFEKTKNAMIKWEEFYTRFYNLSNYSKMIIDDILSGTKMERFEMCVKEMIPSKCLSNLMNAANQTSKIVEREYLLNIIKYLKGMKLNEYEAEAMLEQEKDLKKLQHKMKHHIGWYVKYPPVLVLE